MAVTKDLRTGPTGAILCVIMKPLSRRSSAPGAVGRVRANVLPHCRGCLDVNCGSKVTQHIGS